MKDNNSRDPAKVPLEVERFIGFMRRRNLDVRLSADGRKVEFFSRKTGRRLCSLDAVDIGKTPK